MNIRNKVFTTKEIGINLNKEDIFKLLVEKNLLPSGLDINKVNIFFRVPGGGDWSNMSVDISNEDPIRVECEVIEEHTNA